MSKKWDKAFSILITLIILSIFWLVLSETAVRLLHELFTGHLHEEELPHFVFFIGSAIICIAIVTIVSHDLLVKGRGEKMLLKSYRNLLYIPWELWQIVLANLDVAYRVLHPKMPIDPRIIEFETTLRSDFALVTLANSITLTPGTITIKVDPKIGKYTVHAVAKAPADALLVDQTMQRKVAHVFMEEG